MVEGLRKKIKAMTEKEEIKGLQLHIDVDKKTHQWFVDDTMLMGHSSVQEDRSFKKCLTSFARASSLEVNKEKA